MAKRKKIKKPIQSLRTKSMLVSILVVSLIMAAVILKDFHKEETGYQDKFININSHGND